MLFAFMSDVDRYHQTKLNLPLPYYFDFQPDE